jgi:hypothetical protein
MYFVTYDVPTPLNTVRDQFRAALKAAGWRKLHRSMWVSECDIRGEALESAEQLGIGPFVFIGTGALAMPSRQYRQDDHEQRVRAECRQIEIQSRRNTSGAYRHWAELTATLLKPAEMTRMDRALRKCWEQATRSVRAALQRESGPSGGRT